MFSIIIPYYKKRPFIERCLKSVINQKFQDFEIILVDDGSQDDIAELIAEKYLNSVRVIQQSNQGVSVARNNGIKQAKYDYIAFLDADDYWHPQYLDFIAQIIKLNSDVKIIGSHYSKNKEDLKWNSNDLIYLKFQNYFKEAIKNTYFLTSATVVKKEFFNENDGFNSCYKRGEDIDVWLRAVNSGGNAFYIKNTTVYYSDEDTNQATSSIGNVEKTLVGNINNNYKFLLKECKDDDFSKFVSKYVYFNLYPYYFSSVNHEFAKISLKKNNHYYFFLHLPYYLPSSIGKILFSNKRIAKYLRLYLKFLLRKVYR